LVEGQPGVFTLVVSTDSDSDLWLFTFDLLKIAELIWIGQLLVVLTPLSCHPLVI